MGNKIGTLLISATLSSAGWRRPRVLINYNLLLYSGEHVYRVRFGCVPACRPQGGRGSLLTISNLRQNERGSERVIVNNN